MILLAGPDCIEFGWMVSRWVPFVRKESAKYDKTIIVCSKEHEYLYRDFAFEFAHYDIPGNSDRWLHNGKKVKVPKKFTNTYPTALTVHPNGKNCTRGPFEFKKYGAPSDEKYDIIFHARAMTKYHQKHLNYPVDKYIKLIRELGIDSWRCASIGSVKGAHHIPRTNDLRGIGMGRLCNVLAGSKVCVGTSSGPMHLASFCGCPHVVITGDEYQKAIRATNRKRYEKLWNPFGTECRVLDRHKWKPPVAKVAKAIRGFI